MSNKKVTLTEVAKHSGASVATVSRVLSGSDYPISQKIREEVLQSAHQTGYFESKNQTIQSSNSSTLLSAMAIIVPSLQNSFFVELITGMECLAKEYGQTPIILNSNRNVESERALIRGIIQQKIKTLLLVSIDDNPETLNHYLDLGGVACVVESNFAVPSRAIVAKIDMIQSGYLATKHLLDSGHTKIGFVTTPLSKESRLLVLDGCRMALAQKGIFLQNDDIISSSHEQVAHETVYEVEVGKKLAQTVLEKNKFTALLAVNDMVALGVIHELIKSGCKVPQDISVIGIDNLLISSISQPGLTSVDTSAQDLGYKAAQMVMQSLNSKVYSEDLTIIVSPSLVIRDTVKQI